MNRYLLLFLILNIVACSKDNIAPSPCLITSVGSGSLQPSTYLYTNNKLTGYTDETGVYTIIYDQQNRISKYVVQDGYIITISYNQNNQVDSISTSNSNGRLIQTLYNFYNSTGQVIQQKGHRYWDIGGNQADSTVVTYQYPNATTRNFRKSTLISLDQDTNLTQAKMYVSYEYDDKENPFPWIYPGFFTTPMGLITENNVTKITATWSDVAGTYIQTCSYAYNSKGYPTSLSYTHNGINDGPLVYFNYSNCQE